MLNALQIHYARPSKTAEVHIHHLVLAGLDVPRISPTRQNGKHWKMGHVSSI